MFVTGEDKIIPLETVQDKTGFSRMSRPEAVRETLFCCPFDLVKSPD